MKIARRIKHGRKIIDEEINYGQFSNLISFAGDSLQFKVRSGKGYNWFGEGGVENPPIFIQSFFSPEDNEFCKTDFHGRYQRYFRKNIETHYIDCHLWISRGNTSMVGPKGVKGYEGTVYFTIPKKDLEKSVDDDNL